jgi:four helix bundle protein
MKDYGFRRLEVYQVAKRALGVALENRGSWRGLPGELGPQMERALVSVVLNIAEGAGRWSAADQRRHYQIACGSATEAAACVEMAMMYGAPRAVCEQIDDLLRRVAQMLAAMIRRR